MCLIHSTTSTIRYVKQKKSMQKVHSSVMAWLMHNEMLCYCKDMAVRLTAADKAGFGSGGSVNNCTDVQQPSSLD